jgi:ATP-dependent protease Clp ATPase subunit
MDVMYDLPESGGNTVVELRETDITGETKPEIVSESEESVEDNGEATAKTLTLPEIDSE